MKPTKKKPVKRKSDAVVNGKLWCAACGKWGDHMSGGCPTIPHPKSVEPMVRRRLYDQASGITYPAVVPGKTKCFLILDSDLPRIVEAMAGPLANIRNGATWPMSAIDIARAQLRAIGMEVGS